MSDISESRMENIPLPEYIKQKIHMLKSEFKIHLTYDDVDHFNSLKREIEVDQFAHYLLMQRL